jgi:hypothetical protein
MNHRRQFLRGAALAAPVALLTFPPRLAQAGGWDGYLELTQRTGEWVKVPSERGFIIPWPDDSDDFPPPSGWVSADRTAVTLKTPGLYRLDWRVTFEPGKGTWRGTSSDYWNGIATEAKPDAWHDLADGSAGPPCVGDQETTSVGWARIRSDGAIKVRISAGQNSGKPIRLSDRGYECCFGITLLAVPA